MNTNVMKEGNLIKIKVSFEDSNVVKTLDLLLEEFVPYEPAAYVCDSFWFAYSSPPTHSLFELCGSGIINYVFECPDGDDVSVRIGKYEVIEINGVEVVYSDEKGEKE